MWIPGVMPVQTIIGWVKVGLGLLLIVALAAAIVIPRIQLKEERAQHSETKASLAKEREQSAQALRAWEERERKKEQELLKAKEEVEAKYVKQLQEQQARLRVVSADGERLRKLIAEYKSRGLGINPDPGVSKDPRPVGSVDVASVALRLLDLLGEVDQLAEESGTAALRYGNQVTGLQQYVNEVCLNGRRVQ
jgi:hypothetical protein